MRRAGYLDMVSNLCKKKIINEDQKRTLKKSIVKKSTKLMKIFAGFEDSGNEKDMEKQIVEYLDR